ncbi:hypothetical protein J7E70_32895 [Variovorax paradoxus]|nr:tripartite tricarboxylate transporter substrate-binding protein [Variovorax paradoxus]MBT2305204.1 hypothetical protein [Variovorax paradoxus]
MKHLSCLLIGLPSSPNLPWTIRMLVPFATGTSTDVNSRDFAQLLSEVLQQPVVVENTVDGEGGIAAQALLNAPADGYTILHTSSSLPVESRQSRRTTHTVP